MRQITTCLIAAVALLLASCFSDRDQQPAPHAIVIPPPSHTVSSAQETDIAQGAQAQVDAKVAAADLKTALAEEKAAKAAEAAAKTEQDRAAAEQRYQAALAEANTAKQAQAEAEARAKASIAEQATQRRAEIQGQADRFYWLACFLALGAALMVYEKNLKCAGLLGVLAGGSAVIPSMVGGVLAHEELIRNALVLALVGTLVYHYRTKLEALAKQAEADAKAAAIAVEHAMAHDFTAADAWMKTHHPIAAVEHLLSEAYTKIVSESKLVLAKLHIIKAAAPDAPAAPAPAPAKAPGT